jgi:hypothetical protein
LGFSNEPIVEALIDHHASGFLPSSTTLWKPSAKCPRRIVTGLKRLGSGRQERARYDATTDKFTAKRYASPGTLIRTKSCPSTEERTMWNRWILAIAIFSGLAAHAKAAEFHHMSCTVVRLYVAKYSAPAAEAWARSQGATEDEIMVARRCLREGPVRTATDLSTAVH